MSDSDRMPQIPLERMTDSQQQAVAAFKAARRAELDGPFVPLLRSPEVLNRARALGDYLRFQSRLPARLRELVILFAAREWTQQFEWHSHYPLALRAGLSADVAAAIAEGRRPAQMDEDETAVYDFCSELQRDRTVSDRTYEVMTLRLGEEGLVDVVGLMGYYTLLAMMMNTARTPLPAGVEPPLTAPGTGGRVAGRIG
jgi:4-carboxymuconolactone decarboxylase